VGCRNILHKIFYLFIIILYSSFFVYKYYTGRMGRGRNI